VFAHQVEICRANRARICLKRVTTFETFKSRWCIECELEFLSIEHLRKNNIVSAVRQSRNGAANLFKRHEKVRHHKEESAICHAREHLIDRATELRLSFHRFSSEKPNHRAPLVALT
jgi:protein-arginine kinase activator protein McsA